MKYESDLMTLGEIIEKLKTFDKNNLIFLDFALLIPIGLDSYRGYYDQLAINYAIDIDDNGKENKMIVGEFLEICEKAVGSYFEGYKGGKFKMGKGTPVWVSNYGYVNSTGVLSIEECSSWDAVIINTGYIK
jgi:hypothetical protein